MEVELGFVTLPEDCAETTISWLSFSNFQPIAGNLEDGVSAYRKVDYETAYKLFSIEAKKGNAIARYNLGVMHTQGQGLPQDFKEGVKWYRLAAEQGNAAAQSNLGVMYARGKGVLLLFSLSQFHDT